MNEQQIAYKQGKKDVLLKLLKELDEEPKSNEGCSWNDNAMSVIRRYLRELE